MNALLLVAGVYVILGCGMAEWMWRNGRFDGAFWLPCVVIWPLALWDELRNSIAPVWGSRPEREDK